MKVWKLTVLVTSLMCSNGAFAADVDEVNQKANNNRENIASAQAGAKATAESLNTEITNRIAADQALQNSINTIALTPGPKGDKGDQGIQGVQGEIGATGPQGIQGETGAVGPQGVAGIDGAQGIKGEVGSAGANGAMGPQGIQGETGATGPQGVQGEVGPVGAQGLTGAAGLQGVQGEVGAMGPQGIQGETGAVGPQGVAGVDGATGADGAQGIQGEIGPQGIPGVDGSTGLTGQQGPVGAMGDIGPQGIQGEMGPIGLPGLNGADGATGLPGLNGSDGATGPVGPLGDIGPQGFAGIDGAQGPEGPQGFDGISCWDTNSDGHNDDTEDRNNDGIWSAEDCQGSVLLSIPKIWSGYCPSHGRSIGWNRYCTSSEDFNTAHAQLHVNGDGTFTVLTAGYYRINLSAISNVASVAQNRLMINGVQRDFGYAMSNNTWVQNNMDILWPMNEGDTFYIEFYSSGGTNYAYHSGNASGAHSRIQVSFVGPIQ